MLREHEVTTIESETVPDAMAARPLSRTARGLLSDAIALETRADGILAVLDPSEALSLAWRLRHVGDDIDETSSDMEACDNEEGDDAWPYWQTRACPEWCAVGHADEDSIEERRHDTQWPPEFQFENWRSILQSRVEVEVTGWMPAVAAYAVVRLSLDGRLWSLRVDEALHLARELQIWGQCIDPAARSDEDSVFNEPEFPDPSPLAPRTRSLCPMSGQDAGRMIDIPGMDDWKVKCPACGMTWGGGSTVLDRHFQP